ncbi:MAG TPA: hypothetical protein VGR26_14885 [Acidimicrobiales bacterium]|nr:hypothetical protein [Acidimicrobiales bacterium]
MIRVLGLDIASRCTGVALPNGRTLTIKARTQTNPGPGRMDEQLVELRRLTANAAPEIAAIEGYSMGGLRGLASQRLAETGGIIRWALWRRGVPFLEIPPSTLKVYATGSGRADKDDMVAVAVEGGADVDDHDQADAWLCRAFLLHAVGQPVWRGSARAEEAVEAFGGTARALITVNRPRGSMEAPCL